MFQRIGVGEVAIIILIGVVFFGPKKLPQLGRAIGDSIREFKKSTRGDGETETSGADGKA